MWDLPRPGLEPVSPALSGRFSTTAPPGKPDPFFLDSKRYWVRGAWGENPSRRCVFSPSLPPPSPQSLQFSSLSHYNNLLFNASPELLILTISFLLLTTGCPLKWLPNIHSLLYEVGPLAGFSLRQFKGMTGCSVWFSLIQAYWVSMWSYSLWSAGFHGLQS